MAAKLKLFPDRKELKVRGLRGRHTQDLIRSPDCALFPIKTILELASSCGARARRSFVRSQKPSASRSPLGGVLPGANHAILHPTPSRPRTNGRHRPHGKEGVTRSGAPPLSPTLAIIIARYSARWQGAAAGGNSGGAGAEAASAGCLSRGREARQWAAREGEAVSWVKRRERRLERRRGPLGGDGALARVRQEWWGGKGEGLRVGDLAGGGWHGGDTRTALWWGVGEARGWMTAGGGAVVGCDGGWKRRMRLGAG